MIYYQLFYSHQPQRKPRQGEEDRRAWWQVTFLNPNHRQAYWDLLKERSDHLHEAYTLELKNDDATTPPEVCDFFGKPPAPHAPTSRVRRGALHKEALRIFVSGYQGKLDKLPPEEEPVGSWDGTCGTFVRREI